MGQLRLGLAVGALLICAGPAVGEVVSAEAHGFAVRHVVEVDAPADAVYRDLLRIGAWWSDQHTYSGKASNMRLKARAGGCFCERWDGNEVEHMRVVFVEPGKTLRLVGGLGPLQAIASGALTFSLQEANGKTALTAAYHVAGHIPEGLAALAAPVDQVLGEQIAGLKRYVQGRVGDKRSAVDLYGVPAGDRLAELK